MVQKEGVKRGYSQAMGHQSSRIESRELFMIRANIGAKRSTQTFSVQSFSTTLRVMDVRAKNRGRPHQKAGFPAAPVMRRNFLTPGHPGVRVRNVRWKFGPKVYVCVVFSFLRIARMIRLNRPTKTLILGPSRRANTKISSAISERRRARS